MIRRNPSENPTRSTFEDCQEWFLNPVDAVAPTLNSCHEVEAKSPSSGVYRKRGRAAQPRVGRAIGDRGLPSPTSQSASPPSTIEQPGHPLPASQHRPLEITQPSFSSNPRTTPTTHTLPTSNARHEGRTLCSTLTSSAPQPPRPPAPVHPRVLVHVLVVRIGEELEPGCTTSLTIGGKGR